MGYKQFDDHVEEDESAEKIEVYACSDKLKVVHDFDALFVD